MYVWVDGWMDGWIVGEWMGVRTDRRTDEWNFVRVSSVSVSSQVGVSFVRGGIRSHRVPSMPEEQN